jgi:hypothetical protein
MSTTIDVLLVVPPISPSDTNPPLGPYLLKTCLQNAGLTLEVADLSVRHIGRFKQGLARDVDRVLGDQDKDRTATHAARDDFRSICPLVDEPVHHLPCCADPILGMHFSFESIARAVDRACEPNSACRRLAEEGLFSDHLHPPRALGLSIMGPPQVFFALVIARLAKQRWPGMPVIAGGSHVTLLADQIAADARYGGDIDLFMPGHCEVQFVELVQYLRQMGSLPEGVGFRAGNGRPTACTRTITPTVNGRSRVNRSPFEYRPGFDRQSLSLYDPTRVTLPMQLTRGCSFGLCTYCTYPAVEPMVDVEPDWPRAIFAIAALVHKTGVRRISFKDSLFTVRNLRVLARELRMTGVGIEWSATTLLNPKLTPGLLQELADSGCRTLEFGLESIDPVGQQLFQKPLDIGMVEEVVGAATVAGVAVVLNQILGWPGQSLASAEHQLAWYEKLRSRCPDLVRASINMLEINRASPMATDPGKYGISVAGIGPWAFSFDWNAPGWRPDLRQRLDSHSPCTLALP